MYKTTKMMAVAILASAVLANTSTSAQAARQHEHHEHQEQQEYVSSLEGAITANSVGQKQYKYINHLDIRINNAQFNIVIKNSAGQVISQQELDATVKAVKQVTINGVEVSADKQQDDSGGEIRADLDSVDVESITEIVIVVDLQTEQGVLENVKFVIPQGSVISLSVCPDGSGIDYEIAGWQETIKVEVNEEDVPEEILPPVVPEPELYNIDILYVDKETEKPIKESYNEGLLQGQDWNVEHLDDEIAIEGYVYDSTNGELVGTNAQGDVVIVVYYTKEVVEEPVVEKHNIYVIYQTEDGTHLDVYKEPDVPEGTEYNVTDKANNFTIPGYELKEVTGDPTEGVVEDDVYVYVIFTLVVEEEPKDEETEVVPPLEEDNRQEDGEEVEKEEQPLPPLPPLENKDPKEEEEDQPVPPVIEEPEEEVKEETVPEEPVIPEEPEAPIVPEEPKEEVEQEQPKEEQQKPEEPVVEQEESDKPVTGINPFIATFGTLLTGIGIKLGKKRK